MLETSSLLVEVSLDNADAPLAVVDPPRSSVMGAMFNVANVTLGAGTLSIPFALAQTGLVEGPLLLAWCAVLAFLGVWLVVESVDVAAVTPFSYQTLANKVFGRRMAAFVDAVILSHCFSALVAYQIIIGDLVSPVLQEWSNAHALWWFSRAGVILVLNALVILPLSLLRRMTFLQHTSLVAILCMLYLTGMVVVHAFANGFDDAERGNVNAVQLSERHSLTYFGLSPRVFIALPIIGFAFSSHVQVPKIYEELRERTVRRQMGAVLGALATCSVVYLIVGVFGYITFGIHGAEAVDGNVFNNFTDEDDPYVGVAKLGLAVTLMFSSPLFVHPMREIVVHLGFLLTNPYAADKDAALKNAPVVEDLGAVVHTAITLAVVGSTAFLGIVVPNVEIVLSIAGATVVSVLVYMLPAYFYLYIVPRSDQTRLKRWSAFVLVGWGAIMLIVGTTVVVIENFG